MNEEGFKVTSAPATMWVQYQMRMTLLSPVKPKHFIVKKKKKKKKKTNNKMIAIVLSY